MKQYELLTVLPGTLTETELEPELKQVKETLEEFESEGIDVRDLGKTKMAYQMDGIKYGYYYLFEYKLDPTNTDKLQQELNKQSNLLRAMIENVDSETKDKRREIEEIKAIQSRDEILEWIEEKKEYFEKSEQEQTTDEKTETKEKSEESEGTEETEEEQTDKRTETEEEEDVSIEEIDEKLDDILEEDDLSDV